MAVDELEAAIWRIGGEVAKYGIVDFEAPFWIDCDDNVFVINDAAAVFARYDDRLVYALCGCTDNVEQVVQIFRGGSYNVHYDVRSLRDIAERLMQMGYFAIKRYIDWDKLISALDDEGWHMQVDVNTAVLPLA